MIASAGGGPRVLTGPRYKLPYLVALDFRAGTAHRYVRRKDNAVAGLGWQLSRENVAAFDPSISLDLPTVERFRQEGTA